MKKGTGNDKNYFGKKGTRGREGEREGVTFKVESYILATKID